MFRRAHSGTNFVSQMTAHCDPVVHYPRCLCVICGSWGQKVRDLLAAINFYTSNKPQLTDYTFNDLSPPLTRLELTCVHYKHPPSCLSVNSKDEYHTSHFSFIIKSAGTNQQLSTEELHNHTWYPIAWSARDRSSLITPAGSLQQQIKSRRSCGRDTCVVQTWREKAMWCNAAKGVKVAVVEVVLTPWT